MDENDDGCDERREEEAVRDCCMCERERERGREIIIQWNLSNLDTIGAD